MCYCVSCVSCEIVCEAVCSTISFPENRFVYKQRFKVFVSRLSLFIIVMLMFIQG